MKAQTKALLASIVVIALALTAVSGVTYSWFSDTEKAEIDVTIGEVDIELSDVTLKTYSYVDGSYVLQAEKGEGDVAGFYNSPAGKGALLNKDTSGKWNLTVESIADRDYVEIYGDIINKSTIKTIYRTTIKEVDGPTSLFEALVAGTSTSTSWAPADAASDASGDLIADHKLLAKIGLDNYTGADSSCKIELSVEAYQSNADVDKTVDQTTVKGENTIAMDSTDSSSKLKSATVTVVDPTGGKKIQLSEVASSTYSSYSISGILAGIDLTSSGVLDLYKNCKATIVMVLDGTYAEGELTVYHGDSVMPSTTGSQNNTVTVSSDAEAGTTTVTIVTYDGFSSYLISQKAVKGTNASGEAFYDSIRAATEEGCTNLTILRDYDGANKGLDSGKDEVAIISNAMTVTSVEGVVVKNVNFEINVVSPGKDDVVILKNLHLETDSAHQQVEHMVTLDKINQCKVELSGISFVTGCNYYSGSRTMEAVWANGGSLVVTDCTFNLTDYVPKDTNKMGLGLNNLSSATVTGCTFNSISRPMNIDGVASFESRNNIFNMPATKNTVQKIFNVNNTEIGDYNIVGTTVNWNDGTTANQYGAFIYKNSKETEASDFVINGAFNADCDFYVPSGKNLIVVSVLQIDGKIVSDGSMALGKDSNSGTIIANSYTGSIPISGVDGLTVEKIETETSIIYSLVKDLEEGKILADVLNPSSESSIIGQSDSISIKLDEGNHPLTVSLGDNKDKTITIIGSGVGTVSDINAVPSNEGAKNLYYARGSEFVFTNLTFEFDESQYNGFVCDKVTFIDCTIKGCISLYGDAVFKNCTFDNDATDQYSIWSWGGKDVLIENCTFNTICSKAILLFGEEKTTKLTVSGCTFNDTNEDTPKKAAIEIGEANYGKHNNFTVVISNSTVESGFAVGKNTDSKLWANKNSMNAEHLSVTIDGVKIQ